MGPLVVLIFWALISAALYAVLRGASALVRRRLGADWPNIIPLLRVAPLAIASLPLVLLAIFSGLSMLPESPKPAFARVFGKPPGPGITNLRVARQLGTDFIHIRLAFRADPKQLDGLTAGFTRSSEAAKVETSLIEAAPPAWWKRDACAGRDQWVAKRLRRWSQITVTDCPSDGQIYVEAIRVD